jgi:hypothetical protein
MAQKRDKTLPPPTQPTTSAPGPKRDKTVPHPITSNEPPQPTIEKVFVRPNEGYLALYTTPAANVGLTQVGSKRRLTTTGAAASDGLFKIPRLKPGNYRLEIKLTDHESLSETVTVTAGETTVLNRPLISRFGTVMLAIGAQATADVRVKIDGQALPAEQIKIEGEMINLFRIPVGPHSLEVNKPGYINRVWERVEVKPGVTPDNLVNVEMRSATVTLVVKARPQASVYVDNLTRGVIGGEGSLRITDLAPGAHTLKVMLDGYQPVDRALSLSLERREVEEIVKLDSILETAEFAEGFKPEIKNWTATWPQGWKLEAGPPPGLLVTGDVAAFVDNTSIPNQSFNQYGDFTLLMTVKFVNGKGASWIVRAQDEKNYYLFELATSQGNSQGKAWNFYVCRDGNCALKDSQPCLADIEKPGSNIRISLKTEGKNFILGIPSEGDRPSGRGPTFTDSTFPHGGIGLRTINGLQMFISEFYIQPHS